MRLKDDATTRDHCHECNNGILEAMVAAIGNSKPAVRLTGGSVMTDPRYRIYSTETVA